MGTAVLHAAQNLFLKLAKLAVANHNSPLFGSDTANVEAYEGGLRRKGEPASWESYVNLLARARLDHVDATGIYFPFNTTESEPSAPSDRP